MLENAIGDCDHAGSRAETAVSLVNGVGLTVVCENGENGFWDGSVADHNAVEGVTVPNEKCDGPGK